MKIRKNGKIIGLLIIVLFSLSLTLNTNKVSAFYNWIEWEGYVIDEGNTPISGATVRLKKGSITLDTDITAGNGYYFIREYVDTTDYLKLHVSKTDYTSTSIHVLARDIGEPWRYDFTINYVETWAVIVGIRDYQYLYDLDFCDNDADDWNSHLNNPSGLDFDHVSLYKNTAAYESVIKSALTSMVTDADGGDIIAFIFSGHGHDDDGGSDYSLSMWDSGEGLYYEEDGDLYDTELAAILENSIAARIFLFFDSCYSYGMKYELDNMDNSDTVFLAAAADDDETAYEDWDNDNGCWTQCFLNYAWKYYYSGSTTLSFNTIFNKAVWAYNYIYLGSVNYYNDNQNPVKWNNYGSSFCLSKEGLV